MQRKTAKIPLAALAAVLATFALAALAGCQTSRRLIDRLSQHPQPAQKAPAHADPVKGDLELLRHWLNSEPAGRASLLESVERAHQAMGGDRQTLQLALLLAEPGDGTYPGDLPRAQSLLQHLLTDPDATLSPGEQTLARLELVTITRQLTLQTENRTLKTTGAQQLADLQHELHSATQQNVSLKRQLGQARAKLAAIANIEKSLEGKLGNEAPPK